MCDIQYIVASTGDTGIYEDPTDFSFPIMENLEQLQKTRRNFLNAFDFSGSNVPFDSYEQPYTKLFDEEKGNDLYEQMTEYKKSQILRYTTFDLEQRRVVVEILDTLITLGESIASIYYRREEVLGLRKAVVLFNIVKQIIKTTFWWKSWLSGVLTAVRIAASANCVKNEMTNTCPTKIVLIQIKGGMITDVEKDWLTSGDLTDHLVEYLELPYINYGLDIDVETFDNFSSFMDYFESVIVPSCGI